MAHKTDREDAITKLAAMIEDINIAMLTTVEPDGSLRSRPMGTQERPFDGELWFYTRASDRKVDEVQRDQHVNVSYADTKEQRYISVSGTAELVRDQQKIDELWSPILKAWFPDGKEDPDLALLKITVERAEYWDSPSSKVAHLVGFVKAIVTGTEYSGGENEKIAL